MLLMQNANASRSKNDKNVKFKEKYDIKYFLAKNPANCHNNNQPTAMLLAATIKTGIIKVNKVARWLGG